VNEADRQTQTPDATADARVRRLENAIAQARLLLPILAVGSLIFSAIVLAVNAKTGPMYQGNPSVPTMLGALSAILLSVAIVIGAAMSRSLITRARNGEQVPIERVSGVVITSAALIEGPTLLAAVTALLGGLPYLFITLFGCAMLLVQWMRCADRMREMAGLPTEYTLR
jgi:hypothetical protein